MVEQLQVSQYRTSAVTFRSPSLCGCWCYAAAHSSWYLHTLLLLMQSLCSCIWMMGKLKISARRQCKLMLSYNPCKLQNVFLKNNPKELTSQMIQVSAEPRNREIRSTIKTTLCPQVIFRSYALRVREILPHFSCQAIHPKEFFCVVKLPSHDKARIL